VCGDIVCACKMRRSPPQICFGEDDGDEEEDDGEERQAAALGNEGEDTSKFPLA